MKVALGVTGCIAAYKAAEILRALQKEGAEVVVIMTDNARQFVSPLTFEALSHNPVITDMFEPGINVRIEHIQVARSIDLMIVAPATANILAKFASGIADDFLSTLYLATRAPVLVAPAMNEQMWKHPAVVENVRCLKDRGVRFVDPEFGYLAEGIEGEGRLAEVDKIVAEAMCMLRRRMTLFGEHVLVTAGPTCEDIDPVRYITNRSTGKMGYAIAQEALARGAEVTLVTGPTHLEPPRGAKVINVRSAEEMYQAVMGNLEKATVVIKAAAVADYRPKSVSPNKIKKLADRILLELERTRDILAEVGKRKGGRIVVGFAAETEDLIANARRKLEQKGIDIIVANEVSSQGSGFGSDANVVTIIDRMGGMEELPEMSKREIAARILDKVEELKAQAVGPRQAIKADS